MKLILALIAAVALTACGKKEETYTSSTTPDLSTPVGHAVFIQEHTTASGVKCVVATTYNYGPAISCDWK